MKYALIAPMQPVEAGYRVAEVREEPFEIAPPLFWADCVDEVVADLFWYDPADQTVKPVPTPEPATQPIVEGAQTL